jgi:DNA-binding NarL/FixJ family response regulator
MNPALNPGRRNIAILIACERRMDSELFSRALNRHAGFQVMASAANVEEVVRAIRATNIHIALISTTLADGPLSGILALKRVQETRPDVKVVILLERSESHLVVPVFRAGARGVFCPATDGIERFRRCVERVHDGQIWASSLQLLQVMEAFSQSAPLRIVNAEGDQLLTKREEDVVRLVEQGLTNRGIARELSLSEHTVRNNLFRIFDKLGISTRVELALYAVSSTIRNSSVTPLDRRADAEAELLSLGQNSPVQ